MQIISIQYLRAIAALMVVLFHLHPQLERMGLRAWPGEWLSSGVDIFFVVSGFIMWWTTRTGDISPGDFMRRRIHRVVPVYWALSAVYVAVLLLAPRLMQSGELVLPHAVASFLFIPALHPVTGYMMPLVTPGWTLNYEMFFYVVFAFCLMLRDLRARLAAVSAALIGLATAGVVFDPQGAQLAAYTSTLLIEFLFGIGVAVLVSRGITLPAPAALAAIGVGAAAWILSDGLNTQATRFFWWGLPAMAIVYGAVSWERRRKSPAWPLLLLFGDASYSIYISHQLSLSAAGQAWRKAAAGLPPLAMHLGFVVFGTLVAVVGGLLCYVLVERPLGRLTGRLLPGRGGPPPTVAAGEPQAAPKPRLSQPLS